MYEILVKEKKTSQGVKARTVGDTSLMETKLPREWVRLDQVMPSRCSG